MWVVPYWTYGIVGGHENSGVKGGGADGRGFFAEALFRSSKVVKETVVPTMRMMMRRRRNMRMVWAYAPTYAISKHATHVLAVCLK
eukprot:8521579-Pyramimonas_sp.AAC.1